LRIYQQKHTTAYLTVFFLLGFSMGSITETWAQTELQQTTVDNLLAGVTKIGKPGLPGPIAVIAKNAIPLVVAEVKGGQKLPVIVTARFGKGSVLVFGHNGYLSKSQLLSTGSGRLVRNYLTLESTTSKKAIGVVDRNDVGEFLRASKFVTKPLKSYSWQNQLESCGVLVLGQGDVRTAHQIQRLRTWVKNGGHLVTGGLIWGWRQLNPRKNFARDHGLNQVLATMGLYLDGGTIQRVLQPSETTHELRASCSAVTALRQLNRAKVGEKVSPKQLPQFGRVLTSALRWAPDGQEDFVDSVRALIGEDSLKVVPTRREPLTPKHVFPRLAVTVEHLLSLRAKPEDVRAAASASDFPGQPSPTEKPATENHVLNMEQPGWHSLGLYARAGQPVTIKLPDGEVPAGIRMRIGCHSDELWNKKKWLRHPEISRSWAVTKIEQNFTSPHGGIVYVETPRNSASKSITVQVSGAVPSLHFVLGKTDPSQWQDDVKTMTAPWAELECDLVTLTVKRESALTLKDPTELLKFWRNTLLLYPTLGSRPLDRRPQRFVADRQISLGWLHSGYPIMMQMVHSDAIVNLDQLRDAPKDENHGWGFWHELGHNHQRPAWTFAGTTEVTCNLFSLFVDDKVRGIKPVDHPWARGSRIKIAPFVEKDRYFARWKKEPGLALWTYILIQEAFGWSPFQKAFAEYENAKRSELPRSDNEKRDQFMVRLSHACDRNLGPYFEAWGIPISKSARQKTTHLKPWLPTRIKAFRKFAK
jgi:hypothetical protein